MKVTESAVQLFSEHTSFERHKKSESLSVWKNALNQDGGANGSTRLSDSSALKTSHASLVHLSQGALATIRPIQSLVPDVPTEQKDMMDLNIRILQKMFERITGRKMNVIQPQDIQGGNRDPARNQIKIDTPSVEGQADSSAGFGLEYHYYESHYEYESTSFSSAGTVLTADGQKIDFSVQLNMSRDFYTEQTMNIRMGDALKDPLVVSFSGTATQLTDTKFAFDIDSDGHQDQISFVKDGSGFLALDKNGDNLINDGSELFGPATGSGFAELAKFDEDSNGWIDENDAVFEKLRIWTKDANGDSRLFALGEKGIGAIYLGHVDSPFALKGEDNGVLGQVRSSGVFLNENGSAGTIQQIDLAV